MYYAVLSDIHANRTALREVEAAVSRIRRTKPVDYWFLGDLVGYGPADQAVECLSWLKSESGIFGLAENSEARWVPGNHDECLLAPCDGLDAKALVTLSRQLKRLERDDCHELAEWFRQAVGAIVPQAGASSQAVQEETRSLVVETHNCLTLAFTHASAMPLQRRTTYLHAHRRTLLAEELRYLQPKATGAVSCMVYGHTHFPLLARLSDDGFNVSFLPIKYGRPIRLDPGCYAMNPGSVGQPRDGDPRAAFALVDTEACTVEFRRVEYDLHSVASALNQEANMCQSLADREAYKSLVRLLLDAKGEYLSEYLSIFRRPDADLEVIDVPSTI